MYWICWSGGPLQFRSFIQSPLRHKSYTILFAHWSFVHWCILKKIQCFVLCAKFQKHPLIWLAIMSKWEFTKIQFKQTFDRLYCHASWGSFRSGKRLQNQSLLFVIFSITWWCHQMEIFSVLLAFCAGNSTVTGEFPTQKPVTRSFDVFFDLRLDKQLSKQWKHGWFEMPSRSS